MFFLVGGGISTRSDASEETVSDHCGVGVRCCLRTRYHTATAESCSDPSRLQVKKKRVSVPKKVPLPLLSQDQLFLNTGGQRQQTDSVAHGNDTFLDSQGGWCLVQILYIGLIPGKNLCSLASCKHVQSQTLKSLTCLLAVFLQLFSAYRNLLTQLFNGK